MLSVKKKFIDSPLFKILFSPVSYSVISLLAVLGYFIFFPVVYEQNDDIWMRSIANGYFTGKPDFHLIYENNSIGYLLSFLFNHFQNVEWYALFMISVLLISSFTNLYCILKYESGINTFVLAIFNLFLIYFLSRLQFTYVSGFSAISAVIAQYYGYKNNSKKLLIFSVLLMIISSALRVEMFVFTYFIFFAVFVFNFKKFRNYKIVYAGLVIVILLKLFHNYQYSSEKNWSDYYEFNRSRQAVVSNNNIDYGNKENNAKLNLSEEDISLIKQFIFTENFTPKTMDQFLKENKRPVSLNEIFEFCFSYTRPYFIAICIFFILSLAFRNYRITLLILFHFILVITAMVFVNNIQYRVLYPSLFGIIFFFFKDFNYDKKRPYLLIINLAGLSFFLLAALQDVRQTKRFALRTLDNIRLLERQLPKDRVYIVDTTSNMFIYSRLAFQKPMINTIFFGWITNLPTIKDKYPEYNSNLYEMSDYGLIISEENYKKFRQYIKNKEVYVIQNDKQIKLIKH